MRDALPLFGLAALASSLALFVHVGTAAWLRWREAERAEPRRWDAEAVRLLAVLSAQADRIERTVEAHGTEMERLAEGQRFAARRLAEEGPNGRAAPASLAGPPLPGRVVTPH